MAIAAAGTYPLAGGTVHRLGFGAMQLAGPRAFGGPADRGEALAVLRRAAELGVDHIDTAQYYGPAIVNELIREALSPYPEELAIVSKVGSRRDAEGRWLPAHTPRELRAGVEENLSSLGVSHLRAVNLRLGDDPDPGELDDQLAEMVALRDQGLIDQIGLSNVSLDTFARVSAGIEVACVQNAFHLGDRTALPLIAACATRHIPFVPFNPLGSSNARRNIVAMPELVAQASRLGVSPAQLALAWLLGLSDNVAVIPGTKSLAHLEDNVAAAAVVLDDEASTALGAPPG